MIESEQVRRLAELMNEYGLSEILVSEGQSKLRLRRGVAGPVALSWPAGAALPQAPATVPAAQQASAAGESGEDEGLVPLRSPMVGTWYASPDPDSPPFVSVGSRVEPDTTVCIIEAMKVFNEIKAETSGTVERILVRNEQAVEFGQPLMLIRPG